MIKRLICLSAALMLLLGAAVPAAAEQTAAETALSIARGIIARKKADVGAAADGYLMNEAFLALAGTTPGDWYPIGLSRLGIADNNEGYLAVIRDRVEERYRQPGKLSAAKATEWHRITLAVLAAGGDPTGLGTDENGKPIDLIADGTYDRGKTAPLGRQGLNGWIWGLIALDSRRYPIPDDACYTRADILTEILRCQLADGGFALSGDTADPDMTAMAIQALAPYVNGETVYTYTQRAIGGEVKKRVCTVVDEALSCLSALQLDTGDFKSWGTENVESTDQVLVALCCLGIDPLTDPRFIKNGRTLLDGILRYRMEDGGFIHSRTYDPTNPTSLPDQFNTMASEQTLYAMAALWRQQSGMRTLYDFRPEQSGALRRRIAELEEKIACIGTSAKADTVTELLTAYYSLPENERDYVRQYGVLSAAAEAAGVDTAAIAAATPVTESPADGEDGSAGLTFTDADRKAAAALPDPLTTEQYVSVTTLLDKLTAAKDFDGRAELLAELTAAKEKIAAIQAEIDDLNADIREKLYPFSRLTLRDKRTIDGITARYEALSPYDRAKIERYEDVVKSKTKVDNTLRGIVIGIVLALTAAAVAVCLVRRIRRRRRKKADEMEALAREFADEDDG